MSVTVSNTELVDSFNAWRLNTNLIATTLANNVVTINPGGAANRGGLATGNGHVIGTFSASTLRATTLSGGNTSTHAALTVSSNVTFSGTKSTFNSNTVFTGNVNFTTVGNDRIVFGDIARWRLTGGNNGEFLRLTGSDRVDFKELTLRDIGDLSSNSSNIILSGANTSFSPDLNSPHLVFTGGSSNGDRIDMYLNGDSTSGDSGFTIQLADDNGDSVFRVANRSNTAIMTVDSSGNMSVSGEAPGTAQSLAFAIALG